LGAHRDVEQPESPLVHEIIHEGIALPVAHRRFLGVVMTPREQVIAVLFGIVLGGGGILFMLDYVTELWSNHLQRERVWREIEIRSSRERHPSFHAALFDQDAPRERTLSEAIPFWNDWLGGES
jgi:hypothetical protein